MKALSETSLSVCSAYGSRNIIRDLESGELVCSDCGLVIADTVVSTRPEWSAFTEEEHQEMDRVGPPCPPTDRRIGVCQSTLGRFERRKGKEI